MIDEEIKHPGESEHDVAKHEPWLAAVVVDQPTDERSERNRGEPLNGNRAPDAGGVHAELGREELRQNQIEGPGEPKERDRRE